MIVRAVIFLLAATAFGWSWSAAAQDVRPGASLRFVQAVQNDPEPDAAEADEEAESEPEPDPEPEPPPPPQTRPRQSPQQPRAMPPIARPPPRQATPAPSQPSRPVRAAQRPLAPRVLAPGEANGVPSLEDLAATRDRPLFSSTRRPPPPPEEPDEAPPITEAKSLNFELVGIVRSADAAFAIVRNTESKQETRVPRGERFSGWTIDEIGERSVVLSGEAKRVRLRLYDESKAPGISIRRVGEPDDQHTASPDDDAAVDEEVEPQASPEGRAATAEPVRRRSKNENMSPAQRRKARAQQQRRQQRNSDE
jgi:general secretion pathway protein N